MISRDSSSLSPRTLGAISCPNLPYSTSVSPPMPTPRINLPLDSWSIAAASRAIAREAAAIDQLSNGRLILGVGIGGETEVEYGRFGQKITPRVLGERLDESLDIITGLWSGETLSYHGKHYQIESVRFSPTP